MIPPIVDAAFVTALLGTGSDVVIADVRWYLDGRSGPDAFAAGHLPNAVFVDLPDDLSAKDQPATSGRHPLPTAEAFAATMGALGIGDDTTVIAYDDRSSGTAGRLVWMLRVTGHQAAVLSGGIAGWPGTLETGQGTPRRAAIFTAVPWPTDRFALAGELGERSESQIVLDARANDRFRGDNETIDPVAGHIPFARNAPWGANLDPVTGAFKPPDVLRQQYAAMGIGRDSAVTCYCGSGVSACNDLLALELIGVTSTKLFVPSWSGWSADPSNPVATGDA